MPVNRAWAQNKHSSLPPPPPPRLAAMTLATRMVVVDSEGDDWGVGVMRTMMAVAGQFLPSPLPPSPITHVLLLCAHMTGDGVIQPGSSCSLPSSGEKS